MKKEEEMLKVPTYEDLEYAVVYTEINGNMKELQALPTEEGLMIILAVILSDTQIDKLNAMSTADAQQYLKKVAEKLRSGQRRKMRMINFKYISFAILNLLVFVGMTIWLFQTLSQIG